MSTTTDATLIEINIEPTGEENTLPNTFTNNNHDALDDELLSQWSSYEEGVLPRSLFPLSQWSSPRILSPRNLAPATPTFHDISLVSTPTDRLTRIDPISRSLETRNWARDLAETRNLARDWETWEASQASNASQLASQIASEIDEDILRSFYIVLGIPPVPQQLAPIFDIIGINLSKENKFNYNKSSESSFKVYGKKGNVL